MTEADTLKTANSLLQLAAKLFKVPSKIEAQLSDIYKDLELALGSVTKGSQRLKAFCVTPKRNYKRLLMQPINSKALYRTPIILKKTNEELDEWLKNTMACHDQNTTMARSYLDNPSENAQCELS